jgi:hypothetical protein
MKQLTVLLALLATSTFYSQNAEVLFKEKYSKVGLELGINKMYTSNTPNPALFEWLPSKTFTLGVSYNFYQKENFNFKLSFLYSSFSQNTQFVTSTTAGYQLINSSSTGPYSLFMLPFETEYIFKISDKYYYSLISGVELTYNPNGSDGGFSEEGSGSGGNFTSIETVEYARNFPLYIGFNLGASFTIATKPMLLKLNVKYHYQFEEYIYEGISTITVNGVSTQAKQSITGNYFGFGVSILPNKNWFK